MQTSEVMALVCVKHFLNCQVGTIIKHGLLVLICLLLSDIHYSKWKPEDFSQLCGVDYWYFLVWIPLRGQNHKPRGPDWRCPVERRAVPHTEGEARAEDWSTEDWYPS